MDVVQQHISDDSEEQAGLARCRKMSWGEEGAGKEFKEKDYGKKDDFASVILYGIEMTLEEEDTNWNIQ